MSPGFNNRHPTLHHRHLVAEASGAPCRKFSCSVREIFLHGIPKAPAACFLSAYANLPSTPSHHPKHVGGGEHLSYISSVPPIIRGD